MRRTLTFTVLLALSPGGFAQTPSPPSQRTTFDVVSVKPNTSGSRSSSTTTQPGGRWLGTNITVRQLILTAYRLRTVQLTGGPGWIDSDRFDIEGRSPEATAREEFSQMLRSLLSERFNLKVHTETKEQPVYALVVARTDKRLGPQLKTSTVDCSAEPGQRSDCGTSMSGNNTDATLKGTGVPLSDLAAMLANFVAERMVLDRTGLAGPFDFELRWTPDNAAGPDAAAPAPDAPSIFTALQDQLGLKLEAQRAPVEFLVIDSVERPTPN